LDLRIDWTVSTDNGSLSDTNAKATDQTVPILMSLAKLAGAVAGLDSYQEAEPTQLAHIAAALKDISTPKPGIFDEQVKNLGTQPLRSGDAEKPLVEIYPAVWQVANENRLASLLPGSFDRHSTGDRPSYPATLECASVRQATDQQRRFSLRARQI